ncbi:MAG TPA: hypothetical protein VMT29_22985 [Steroidobacteraceae bacterium]|nr:hypothetical protein [Steroidobacteraceae bacterium]
MRFAGHTVSRNAVGNLLASALIVSTLAIPWRITSQSPWTIADAWYRAPPPDFAWEDRRIYSGIYEVPDSRIGQAQRLLETQPVVELQPKDVHEFSGRETLPPPGFKPYLIRGVDLGRRGQYSIALSGNAAVVVYETGLAAPSAMQKRPLVVFLPEKPGNVYVTLSTLR